ncbi:MAG: hypothetical protein HY369_01490 [Candidatus Aenigmarchaeota archaeon]|nr:hypothetical protein [Candidatus Aenigmarchaeota archaeon]
MFFKDRAEAGAKLAERFPQQDYAGWSVVGIARGGAVVGAQVAKVLGIPLHVLVVEKLALRRGSLHVTSLGTAMVLGRRVRFIPDASTLKGSGSAAYATARTRSNSYNGGQLPSLASQRIILVDDGIVNGATFAAARMSLLSRRALPEIAAFPVVPPWVPAWIGSQDPPCKLVTWRVSTIAAPTGMFYFSFPDVVEEEITTSRLAGAS